MSIPHSTQEDEIRGDWSVLKGTEYHLVYALWLIFCERAIDVAFYEGNDLRARPSPPAASNSDNTLPVVAMHSRSSGEEDWWIQLKSTDKTWTLSQFLPSETAEDNLLVNFICNAAQSERDGRRWRACLITPARVNGKELDEFVTAPANNSRYHQRLLKVVARAHKRLENEVSQPTFDKNYLEGLGLEVLKQLAQTVPTSQELLKAQVEIELAYLLPDRGAVRQTANPLLGALLTDTARKPAPARRYDVDWVNDTAGLNLHSYDLFDRDPVVACGEVVKQNLPRDWEPRRFIPRGRLHRALEQFIKSPETVFVLVGTSGTGKSWAMADWMTDVLTSQARLLATGVAFETHQNLPALAGRYLRQYTAVGGWTDEYILRRLAASARVNGRGPLVVVIDDLLISQSNSAHFGRNLAEIVERCREYGIKLVLTCQLHVWELHGLGRAIPSGDIFSPSDGFALKPVAKTSKNPYSFLLTDLTHDELRQALQRWVPEERAGRAALLLRAPAFAALRNPYLLTRYMEQHGGELGVLNKDPAPLVIDNLLDTRVQNSLEKVALAMSLNVDDVRPAFDSLIGLFWIKRTVGVSYKEAADCINQYLTGQSQTVIAEMRRVGLLSTEGGIGLSEPRVAERLFAKLVGARMSEDARVLAELSPEVDSEVVAALLRGVASDPVVCAEQLLQRDARWVSAVASGLGHCSPADERVVTLLMALARPDNNRILVREAGEALGQIASRGKRAWKRVAEMYLDIWRPLESYRGAYALGAAMEFAPRWAGAAVRLRLSKAAKIRSNFHEDQKTRQRLLKGALEPLRDIKHEEAARIGKRLISLYSPLGGRNERDSDYDFLEHLDHARSGIALYGGAGELSTLLEELRSDNRLLRYRAACAMRGIAIEQPQLIQGELIAAIANEEYAKITNRLLLAAYHLIKTSPELILRTLQLNGLTDWRAPGHSTGQVLGMLGDLASRFPQDVFRLLPRQLDTYEPQRRALHSEMLAYAWWRCAEQVGLGGTPLAQLAVPDMTDLPDEYRPFALRGASLAQLALMCLERKLPADKLTGEQTFYPLWDLSFAYLNAQEFIQQHTGELLRHSGYVQLQATLLACVQEEARVEGDPRKMDLMQSRFTAAVKSMEMLFHFATAQADPTPLLRELPDKWQVWEMAHKLIAVGRAESSIVNFTRRICEEHGDTGSVRTLHERNLCFAQLALLDDDPNRALKEYRAAVVDGFFNSSERAYGLAKLSDAHPSHILSLLDESVEGEKDLPTLYYWEEEAHSWRGLMIARVFARMFNQRPITPYEAKELCAAMLTAARSLPASAAFCEEYLWIYQSINHRLTGSSLRPSVLTQDVNSSLLHRSHDLALEILQTAEEAIREGRDAAWLIDSLADARGWLVTNYALKHGSFARTSIKYLNYVFPAVRLALVAVGMDYRMDDLAGRLLLERDQSHEMMSGYNHALDMEDLDEGVRQRARVAAEEQLRRTPRDEQLWGWYGHLLLRLDCLDEAAAALERSLKMRSCVASNRAPILYNLACAYARLDREEDCRRTLEEHIQIEPLDPEWIAQDRDMDSVRGSAWFESLLKAG